MWIPQENENSQRTASHQPQKKTRQKAPDNGISRIRTGFSFPKSLRILSRRHFQRLSAEGERLPGKVLFFQYAKGRPSTKLGITVSKKYGDSHERNYFKRLVREVFRENYDKIPHGVQLSIHPRLPRKPLSKAAVLSDFLFLIQVVQEKP